MGSSEARASIYRKQPSHADGICYSATTLLSVGGPPASNEPSGEGHCRVTVNLTKPISL